MSRRRQRLRGDALGSRENVLMVLGVRPGGDNAIPFRRSRESRDLLDQKKFVRDVDCACQSRNSQLRVVPWMG